MTAVIEVTGLTKRYGGQAVVDGLTFHVEQGEIFGILGAQAADDLVAETFLVAFGKRQAMTPGSATPVPGPTASPPTSWASTGGRRSASSGCAYPRVPLLFKTMMPNGQWST
jgi:hypothetical protein